MTNVARTKGIPSLTIKCSKFQVISSKFQVGLFFYLELGTYNLELKVDFTLIKWIWKIKKPEVHGTSGVKEDCMKEVLTILSGYP